MKIFYSWQSWSPRSTNWTFIQEAIELAISRIQSDETLEFEPVLDRDTQGEPGSVAIADTIFRKITECTVFICDVTIVTSAGAEQPIPNPNVMIELGYAAAHVGWENIICVVNQAYGSVKQMPFDLMHRRLLTYSLDKGQEKASERRQLGDKLYDAIRIIIQHTSPKLSLANQVEQLLASNERIELEKLLRTQREQVYLGFTSIDFYSKRTNALANLGNNPAQAWINIFPLYFDECKDYLELMITVAWYGQSQNREFIDQTLTRWLEESPRNDERYVQWRYLPSLLLIYAVGIAGVAREKWDFVSIVLSEKRFRLPEEHSISSVLDAVVKKTFAPYEQVRRIIPSEPLGIYLQKYLRSLFDTYLPSDQEFCRNFDIFEMLLSLMYFKQGSENTDRNPIVLPQVALSDVHGDRTEDERLDFWFQGGRQGNRWGLLQNGLLGNDNEKLLGLVKAYQAKALAVNRYADFRTRFPDYVSAYNRG